MGGPNFFIRFLGVSRKSKTKILEKNFVQNFSKFSCRQTLLDAFFEIFLSKEAANSNCGSAALPGAEPRAMIMAF